MQISTVPEPPVALRTGNLTTDPRLSLQTAAEVMGVSTRTIRRWIAAGYLPAERIGAKTLRIRLSALENLGNTVPSATSASRVR